MQCEVLGFSVSWGNSTSGAACRVPDFFPSMGNLAFLPFDYRIQALLLSGTVENVEYQYSMGMEFSWHQQISKIWSLGFNWVCDGSLLELCIKLCVPVGQQGQRLELSGTHKAVEVLGSICVWVWSSRTHTVAAGDREQSLQAAGVLGPNFLHGLQESQSHAAASSLGNKACRQ
jgi:hypothetical protein